MAAKVCVSKPTGGCLECNKCNFGQLALRCNTCRQFCHFECSLLPEYQLARYLKTRTSFICRKCVMNEGWAKEGIASVQTALAFERTRPTMNGPLCSTQTRLPSTPLAPSTPSPAFLTAARHNTSSAPTLDRSIASPLSPLNASNKRHLTVKKRVCWRYLQGKCDWENEKMKCNYSHPKICHKFSTFGSKNQRGCKNGRDCQYYHPLLCWNTVKNVACKRDNCRFHHLKLKMHLRGNAEEMDSDSSFSEHRIDSTAKLKTSEKNYMVKKNQFWEGRIYRNQRNRAVPTITTPDITSYRSGQQHRELDNRRNSFLDLQRQVDQIQQQMQQLLTLHEQQQKPQQQLQSQRPLAMQCRSN